MFLFQLLLLPVLTFFAITKTQQQGFSAEVGFIVIGAVLCAALLFALRYMQNLQIFFRLGSTFIMLFAWYETFIGGGGGGAFLWFYFHPLASFFLFGKREGSWWTATGTVGLTGIMLFDLGSYHYPPSVAIRFILSYLVVCLLSYALEEARARYYAALLAEKVALEEALTQVQTLQRLIPICASCKKVRDDQGYWHQVETYIGHHAAVEFSHGLCPNCRAALFPDMVAQNSQFTSAANN